MQDFLHTLSLASPLFLLILVGFALMRVMKWPRSM